MYFDVVQLACDVDHRRILSVIDNNPKSVKSIAKFCHMSLSRCYRLIKEMEYHGILRRVDSESYEVAYLSNLKSVEMVLEDDNLYLSVAFRDGTRHEVELNSRDLEKQDIPSTPQEVP